MAHLGLQPQKFSSTKKFKIYGKKKEDLNKIISDSLCLEKAGAVSILLEGMLTKIAKQVTTVLSIPTIGIGASEFCDGQILVTDDMLGLSGFYPKFVKKYANLNGIIEKATKKYTRDVKLKKFPSKKYFLNGPKFR